VVSTAEAVWPVFPTLLVFVLVMGSRLESTRSPGWCRSTGEGAGGCDTLLVDVRTRPGRVSTSIVARSFSFSLYVELAFEPELPEVVVDVNALQSLSMGSEPGMCASSSAESEPDVE
jgi:hypothetical protein